MVILNNVYQVANNSDKESLPPDEVLTRQIGIPPIVPVIQRDSSFQLPDSDLLNILHYYISLKYQENERFFDETCLLSLGMIIEDMVDEIFNDEDYKLFLNEISLGFKPVKKSRN